MNVILRRKKHFIHSYSTEEQPHEIMLAVVDIPVDISFISLNIVNYCRLCRLRAWWRVWTADPRELRGWEEWSCRVLQNTARHLGSGILHITKPWTLCLDWGRWKDDTNCAWLYCIVIVQSWFSHFYKLSMFLTLRKNETKHVNDINIHDSECCVITEQHQHFSITGHK